VIRVAISILNFKNAEATIDCAQSLLCASEAVRPACLVEVFVADNGSGDDEQHQLQQAIPAMVNVHLQLNAENLGFSAGHNRNLEIIFARYRPDYCGGCGFNRSTYKKCATATRSGNLGGDTARTGW